jgi:hypothetical protein
LDPTGQPGHGDAAGSSDAQTPQHPSMSHIPCEAIFLLSVAHRTETPGAHETPPPHMLDHARDGLQGESHEDIGSVQPEHCYPGASCVQSSRTLSIKFLVDDNLVPLKIQQIPGIFEYLK